MNQVKKILLCIIAINMTTALFCAHEAADPEETFESLGANPKKVMKFYRDGSLRFSIRLTGDSTYLEEQIFLGCINNKWYQPDNNYLPGNQIAFCRGRQVQITTRSFLFLAQDNQEPYIYPKDTYDLWIAGKKPVTDKEIKLYGRMQKDCVPLELHEQQ